MEPQAEHQYISGHHASVLRSHTWRTVLNSAAYALPHIKNRDDLTLLDVGCGPGTITLDFAAMFPKGHVVGIDPSKEVIEKAKAEAKRRGIHNVTFEVGDIFNLSGSLYQDSSYDVVHAHQVLQHIPEPVKALQEMWRLLKAGGLLASREAIFSTFTWWPKSPAIEQFQEAWVKVARSSGCDADLGTSIPFLSEEAGFDRERATPTAGAWCYATAEDREWWGSLWAERLKHSDFPKLALARGFAAQEDLDSWSKAMEEWAKAEHGWFGMLHAELVCRK